MTTLPTQDAAVTAEEAKTMQDTHELPPLPAYVASNDYRRENYYTADQMREYVLADRATRLAAAPKGWKLVEDFHIGDRVIFEGVEHLIFALGDRPGTFDIQLPSGKGDRWRNVPPSVLKYAAAPDAAPAASSPEPVAWRRKENGEWIYYATKAWDDLEPLYDGPVAASSPEVADERALPRLRAYDALRQRGQWPNGVPAWARDYRGQMNDLTAAHAVIKELRAALASAPAGAGEGALEEMRARKDAAYEERNKVVAALARLFPSGVARTAIEGWSEDWHGCVYIDLPTGQVSWHFHDSQAHLFAGLPPYTKEWDGHDTPEKYRRLAALAGEPAVAAAADEGRDAARYRWLRGVMGTTDRRKQDAAIKALDDACADPETPEAFDAAIDAARAASQDEHQEQG